VSIPRLLYLAALLLFVVFIATFFTVLIRLSRIGITTERLAQIHKKDFVPELNAADSLFEVLEQDSGSAHLKIRARAIIDTSKPPFNTLKDGDPFVLRLDNFSIPTYQFLDVRKKFENPTGDRFVIIDFGDFDWTVIDNRDFYPFDIYDFNFKFAYYVPAGWYEPGVVNVRSQTSLIFIRSRFSAVDVGQDCFQIRISRLRLLHFLTATLILIELLFMVYLVTITDLQELLAKALGYLVGLYIIREVVLSRAPYFPTILDYGTLFLIIVTFFIMLFKFLGRAEERVLITLPFSAKSPSSRQDENSRESEECAEPDKGSAGEGRRESDSNPKSRG